MEVGIKKEAVGSTTTLGRERTSKIVSIELGSDNESHFDQKAYIAAKDAHRSRSLVSSGAGLRMIRTSMIEWVQERQSGLAMLDSLATRDTCISSESNIDNARRLDL